MNTKNRTRFDIATAWYYQLQEQNIDIETVQEWQSWLVAHPENAREFERVEEVLSLAAKAEHLDWPDDSEVINDDYDADISVQEWQKTQRKRAKKSFARWGTISQGSFFNWRPIQLLAFSAVYGALLLIAAANIVGIHGQENLTVSVYESATGENRSVTLKDGSIITLGAQSLVSVALSNQQRRVVLERGEAYFDVAKDKNRPFVVMIGNRIVTAVGTEFNISKQQERVVVTVTEGKVSVKPEDYNLDKATVIAPNEALLSAGQRVLYDKSDISPVEEVPTDTSVAWRKGRLQYLNEDFKFVIEDINRYSTKKIIVGDEIVKSFAYSGTVFTTHIDDWLAGLPHAFPIAVKRLENGDILITSSDVF